MIGTSRNILSSFLFLGGSSTNNQNPSMLSDGQYTYLVSTLFTAYAAPNLVLPFLSGLAMHRFGEARILVATLLGVVSGQLMFSLAVQTQVPTGMVLGRI